MAIRYVSFVVSQDTTVTPTTPQYGGVQGEHNATEVAFIIEVNGTLANPNYTYYIECVDAAGGYDRTDTLYRRGGEISTLVPLAWTQYGGISTLRLVAEEAGATVYSVEARLLFEDRQTAMEKVDGLLRTNISETLDSCTQALADCRAAVEDAAALNADTRAAIDALPPLDSTVAFGSLWSSRHTADRLCPPIEMSGQSVTCHPVVGYPLEVSVGRPNYMNFNYAPPLGESWQGGITFTRYADGRITVNGTATCLVYYYIFYGAVHENNPLVEVGVTTPCTLKLTGTPAGGSVDSYHLCYYGGGNDGWMVYDYGDGAEFNVTQSDIDAQQNWECIIVIKPGTVCNNLVFRPRLEPMGDIRLSCDDGTQTTVTQLTDAADLTVAATTTQMTFSVTDNATVTVRGREDLHHTLGSTEAALDGIIAIQEALIGGEGV